ncbi:hypothetical protein [Cytophaga aurantiaca]|uniref:hypothetical protein n=1 Tax=Cytophaga aurantiaca TaxID=29530 RepID=UPI00036CA62A|nr:hypothetical protein [Cytophaga aurantiaca]
MKTTIQQTLLRTHVIALTIAIVNAVFKFITIYSLTGNVEFIVEMITVISGAILFFFYLKSSENDRFYFLIYPLVTFLLIVAFVTRGIIGLLILILLFPLIPDTKEYEQDGIIMYTPYQGPMAECCRYQVKERKLLFFEKDLGVFGSRNGPIQYEKMHIEQSDKELIVTFATSFHQDSIQTDIIKR